MDKHRFKLALSMNAMSKVYWVLLLVPFLPLVVIGIWLNGISGLWKVVAAIHLKWIAYFLLVIVMHEILHALGYWAAGATLNSIKFIADGRSMSVECRCSSPMTITGLRLSVLLPLLLLTPALVWLAVKTQDSGAWLLLSLSVSGCAFDLTVIMSLLNVPNETKVIPELIGEDGDVFLRTAA